MVIPGAMSIPEFRVRSFKMRVLAITFGLVYSASDR